MPALDALEFERDDAYLLRIGRLERTLNESQVYTLYLEAFEADDGRRPQRSRNLRRAGALKGAGERGAEAADAALLPIFLRGVVEGEAANAVLQVEPEARPSSRRAGNEGASTGTDTVAGAPGVYDAARFRNVAYLWRVFRHLSSLQATLREMAGLQRMMGGGGGGGGGNGSRQRRQSIYQTLAPRLGALSAYRSHHELLLDLIENELGCTVAQVVLAPPPGDRVEQLRAFVCLEKRASSTRQSWFMRARASDGVLMAYLRRAPVLVKKSVWEAAAVRASAIPLGESVTLPRNTAVAR